MDILVALGLAIALILAFRTPLVRIPGVFYVMTVAIDLLFLSGALEDISPDFYRELLPFLRRCIFPYALFVIVMYIGVLPESSRLRQYLNPVRGSLSIVATLLALCHVVSYLGVYASVALGGFSTAASSTTAALATALLLCAILGVLAGTSFALVRRRMQGKTWRAIQKLSYPFFALVTVHAVVLLLPASMTGGAAAFSVSLYSGVFLLYVILRLARWARTRCGLGVQGALQAECSVSPDLELELA